MIPLPETSRTPIGQGAFAVADFTNNRVKLIGGGMLKDYHPDHTHAEQGYWSPPASATVPGWQLIGVGDGRQDVNRPENIVVLAYEYPNGGTGTYRAEIVTDKH